MKTEEDDTNNAFQATVTEPMHGISSGFLTFVINKPWDKEAQAYSDGPSTVYLSRSSEETTSPTLKLPPPTTELPPPLMKLPQQVAPGKQLNLNLRFKLGLKRGCKLALKPGLKLYLTLKLKQSHELDLFNMSQHQPAKPADGVPATEAQPKPRVRQFGDIDPSTANFAPPPKREVAAPSYAEDDPANPIHTVRDPHKLVAYIVPLPTPTLPQAPTDQVPHHFLLYTPPAPPLKKPTLKPGEKEDKVHMVQRKWQEEVRKAKTSQEKTRSFKGFQHLMVRTTNKAIGLTTSANLDFLSRAGSNPSAEPAHARSPAGSRPTTPEQKHSDDGVEVTEESKTTVPVEEILFIYPQSMGTNEAALREEFINTLMRTKSQAQRDSVIASGLVPVGFGIDFLLVVVGGLGEIATVWAFKSIMGAKTARSISKRLASTEANGKDQLKISFQPSARVEVLKNYLEAECNRVDPAIFPRKGEFHVPPTETQVLDAIGWSPHHTGGETTNWEDEQWEVSEVKEDWKLTMTKGAKEWKKWCHKYEHDWEKERAKEQRNKRSENEAEKSGHIWQQQRHFMFRRASGATYLCLACQLRQSRSKQAAALLALTPDSSFVRTAIPHRRPQSTVALHIDDNEEQHQNYSASEPGPQTEGPKSKNGKKKSAKFRVWRPSPTAELGMNALGKPSEVLLLSPRDRKIPIVPKEQDAEPKESFYETLASETQPSTWEQVKENISQARHQIQPQQGALSPDVWAALKKTLLAGFTQKQLRRYFEEHKTADTRLPALPKMAGKDGVIKAIAKHVWRYDLRAAQSRSASAGTEPVAHKAYRLSQYNETRQIALTRAPVDNVFALASKSGVSIEFGEKHTIISGPSDQASEVRNLIQQQTAAMTNVQRHIPEISSTNRLAAFVDNLGPKYGLFARLKPKNGALQLNMVCTPAYEDAAHRLYHELCLAAHRHSAELACRTSLAKDQELVWCRDQTPLTAHMLPLSARLYRPYPKTGPKAAEPAQARVTLGETVIPHLSIHTRDPAIQVECSAEFGRGLFDNVKDLGTIPSKQKLEASYPSCAFVPAMPLLQQFLSGGHLDKEAPAADKSDAIMTLVFSPLWPQPAWQAIHVDVAAPKNQQESLLEQPEQSPPQIQRIRVVEAQSSFCLLRPESVVDIKVSCRHWREIYSAESPTESVLFQSVRDALSKWLLLPRDMSSLPAEGSESVRSLVAPILFLEQPSKAADTTPAVSKKKKGVKKIVGNPDSEAELYILSDFYLNDSESYSCQHKDRRYSVEYANLVAQNPNTAPVADDNLPPPVRNAPPTPFDDRQTLTLRHILTPEPPVEPSSVGKTKTQSKTPGKTPGPTASDKAKTAEEVEDFIGAALSLARKWQTEASKFKQRIEMPVTMVKIALAGGSGDVAQEIRDVLVATKKHEILILSRRDAPAPGSAALPAGVSWVKANYNDVSQLAQVLQGVNTVLSFVTSDTTDDGQANVQKNLIDAAVQAGVKRFAPSEWATSGFKHLDWYSHKATGRKYLADLNRDKKVLEYTLFQPGLFLNYFTGSYPSSNHLHVIQTPVDFEGRRAILVEGSGDDASLTLTTVQDLAHVVARAIDYEGEWPVVGGIKGAQVSLRELVTLGEKIRGGPFPVEYAKVADLEQGKWSTSWTPKIVHSSLPPDQADAVSAVISAGILLAISAGSWTVSDEWNRLLPDYSFTQPEEFLTKAWAGKP
ncbi:hypothetical protein DV738_g5038, partial [Chaetothyriales sp. CBS 135597]